MRNTLLYNYKQLWPDIERLQIPAYLVLHQFFQTEMKWHWENLTLN